LGIGTTAPFSANGTNIEVANGTVSRLVLNQTGTRRMSLGVGANAFNIYDETSNAERFKIDSSGRVTTPAQPAFHAYLDSNQSVGTQLQQVSFNVERFDIGSIYNTANSRCTVPVAGVYQINTNVSINSGAQFEVQLFRNGGSIVGCYGSTNQTTAHGWGISTLLSLSANDYLEVFTYSGSSRTNAGRADGFCSFSVSLLG
jgi:hypothetical protein